MVFSLRKHSLSKAQPSLVSFSETPADPAPPGLEILEMFFSSDRIPPTTIPFNGKAAIAMMTVRLNRSIGTCLHSHPEPQMKNRHQ